MKGLILKDLYLSWKYYKSYLLIAAVFILLSFWAENNLFLLCYPFMLIGLIPMGLLNMDESYKWDVYCGSLPCSKKQQVTQKYLMGPLFAMPVTIVLLLAKALDMTLDGVFQGSVLVMLILIAWMLGLLMTALSLPLLFKFGSEKGRVAQYLVIGTCVGFSTLAGVRTGGQIPAFSGGGGAILIMLVLPPALYALSWLLSVRIYEKREIL